MAEYKKGGFGGKRFGGGGRPHFGADRGRPEMHAATCSECGNACEVPFRPTGERPVYCRDCFGTKDASGPRPFQGNGGRDFKSRDSFRPRNDFKPRFDRGDRAPSGAGDAGVSSLKREIEMLGGKIDRLVQVLESRVSADAAVSKAASIKDAVKNATETSKKKKVSKKK